MHILVITPGFPKNEKDTSCIPAMQDYLLSLLNKYPSLKISVVSILYPYVNKIYIWRGIKVFNCGSGKSYFPIKILYWIRAIIYSLKINRKLKIDVIHSFWLGDSALIGSILSKLFKITHISTMMGQDVKRTNNYLKLLPLKNIIKVALSENHSEIFKKSTGLNPNYIIPWGIDKINFVYKNRPIDIVGVGSLIPIKNFKLFVNIIIKLKEQYPAINCVLIGEGTEKEELVELIREKNLSNNIKLTGQLPREKVFSIMTESRILLHPSDFESFGLVILEGLTFGCYVVCKNVGIAKASEKIFIFKTIEEACMSIVNIFQKRQDFAQKIPYKITDTVSSYMKLYAIIKR